MASEKILIIDDDPIQLKLTRILLAAKGYLVEAAETGQFAIEVLRTFRPALILTDYQLPDIDGLELTRQIKANPETRGIPVVLMTAGSFGVNEKAARDAGCIGFIVKPIRAQTFGDKIRVLLTAQGEPPIPSAVGRPVLVVNDDPVERRLLQERLSSAGFTVELANDGVDGLECARERLPAAIVSDILMPRLDGFKMCAAIRGDAKLQHIPVVLTTSGSIQKNDELMADSIGANAFVLRTPDMKDVVAALRMGLLEGAPQPAQVDFAVIEALRRYFVEEGERQTMRLLDQLKAGVNRNALRRLAHRWAGVGGTFGYPAISRAALDLETIAQHAAPDPNQIRPVLTRLSELFMEAVGRV